MSFLIRVKNVEGAGRISIKNEAQIEGPPQNPSSAALELGFWGVPPKRAHFIEILESRKNGIRKSNIFFLDIT